MTNKINLNTAILICLNTMIGAGIFINPAVLTLNAGPWGFVGYLAAALVMLPMVICISELAQLHPVSGGLYVYSQQYLGDRIGFIAAWSFFLAKTVSPILILHKVVGFFHARIDFLQEFSHLTIDYIALLVLISLIIFGVKIGGRAQYFFISLKSIPVFFVFFLAIMIFNPGNFSGALQAISPSNTLSLLPVAIFGLTGFEIICGIGGLIEDPERNIRRAIIIAFSIVVAVTTLFQLCFFGALGNALSYSTEPVLSLANGAMPNIPLLGSTINAFVFASMLGGVFSMLASGCWYIHTFGAKNHFPGAALLTKINQHNVPWAGVLIQAAIAAILISITQEQTSLQAMSVFALVLCYTITACSTLKACLNNTIKKLSSVVPITAIGLSSYVIFICLQKIQAAGISFSFLGVFFAGIVIEVLTKKSSKSCH